MQRSYSHVGGRWPAPLSPTLLVFPVAGLVIPLPFAIKDIYLDTTSDATAMGPGLRPFADQTPPDHGCVTSPSASSQSSRLTPAGGVRPSSATAVP
jgi:hypothetical protein